MFKCSQAHELILHTLLQTCENLGAMVAHDKTVLGIEIDTIKMVLRLPDDKLERLSMLLALWHGRTAEYRRDLESLVGLLQHASCVVRPGCIFIRRIYSLLAKTHHVKPHQFVHINCECRADIEWWYTFIRGTSLLCPLRITNLDK